MKAYKIIMRGGCSAENFSSYSIYETDITYESVLYAARELAEDHIDKLLKIREKHEGFLFGLPRIIEIEIYTTTQPLKKHVEETTRSNY